MGSSLGRLEVVRHRGGGNSRARGHNRAVTEQIGVSRSRPAAVLLVAFAAAACQHRPVADPTAAQPSFAVTVRLARLGVARHRSVELWIARPLAEPQRPLVLHLTGDSGRHGFDLLLFTALTRWGYPVAILGSQAWANTLPDRVATPRALAADLDLLGRAAARAVGLTKDRPFVLLGQSRGAGLAVEAASEPTLSPRLLGVVALGLCPEEELVHRGHHAGRPYRDKDLLGALPLEVIQSTHDRYMDAAAARAAFGPDREHQRLHAVEARSHTFAGNREALLDQLRDSLERIIGR